MYKRIDEMRLNYRRQKGAITMFSAVLILILLTELIIYAVQVGVFEQRKSSNEMRQKEAFHVADSALQQAKEFLRTNSRLIASNEADLLPIVDEDGDIVGFRSGWLAAGSTRWSPCAGAYSDADRSHPCWAEPIQAFRDNSYFYSFDDSIELLDGTVLDENPGTRATTHALLCMLILDRNSDPVVQGCAGPGQADLHDSRYYLVTMMARGEAECDGGNCLAEALVSERVGSFGPASGAGGPGAPLTTKSTLPESSSTDIVANPNGTGVGVPMSVWMDASVDVGSLGNAWATCERHEWYGVHTMPEDYRCPEPSGNCTCSGKKQLSYPQGSDDPFFNMDFVWDDDFPPDLFQHIFLATSDEAGVEEVKGFADDVVQGCSSLGPHSYGLIVVEGDCDLGGNVVIGSGKAPVFLLLTGAGNKLNGTVEVFGTVMVTDAIGGGDFAGKGNLTIYGALIADGDITQFGGNLKLVYVEDLIDRSRDLGGFGAVAGGWTDFHPEWR